MKNPSTALSTVVGVAIGLASLASAHDTEFAKLTASDGLAGDQFGFAVSLDAGTMVVGAPFADNPGSDTGAAYVFVVSGTTWVEHSKLVPSEAFIGDRYGSSVAVSGSVIVVGSPFHDDNGSNSGTVFIWERSGTTWTESVKLLASDGQTGDLFGRSVAVSGSTIFVGAPGGDKFYVITKNGSTWSEDSIITGSDTIPGDLFGHAVAIDGNRAIISAPLHDELGTDSGVVYAFERSGTTWNEGIKLIPSDGAGGDLFGSSLALEDDQAMIGAPLADITAMADAGAAYEFVRSPLWTEVRKYTHIVPGPGDRFGNTVAIANSKRLVGVRFDDQAAINSGSAFEFFCLPGSPPPSPGCLEVLVASDAGTNDQLGASITGAGCWYSVGATLDDDLGVDAGAVYVYLLPRETTFCTAKVNACGGTPAITHTGLASASATSGFTISASGARLDRLGFLIYTNNGRLAQPFALAQGGFVCINPWEIAAPVVSSGGTPGQCNSTFTIDMNAFASGNLGGSPQPFLLVPGTVVDMQIWHREDSVNGIYLTEGFEYTICP